MKKIIITIILFLTILVASIPLLSPQLFRTHDYIHGVRIAEMTLALQDGHFPVRWTKNFGYGYGMPLFEFYAPFPYYVGSFWYLFTRDLLTASKLLWLIPNVLSTVGAYLLGKRLYGRKGGVIAAVVFTLAPYRAVNLYIRGAIGEAWGMMFFPWIFLGILDFFQHEKNRWQLLLFSLVGLILSHNLMAMLFFPTSFLFAVVLLFSQKSQLKALVQSGIRLLAIFVGAIGVTTFYWLPALVEKGYTQVESRILSGYFHYSQHFLYIRQFFQENWKYGGSGWGPNDDMSFFLGFGQWGLLVLLFFTLSLLALRFFFKNKGFSIFKNSMFNFQKSTKNLISNAWRSPLSKAKCQSSVVFLFSFFFFPISLFFTLQKSEFIWNNISFLQTLQFPWRFLSLAIFFLALVVASLLVWTKNKILQVFGTICLLSILVRGLYYFQPEKYLQSPNPYYYDDPKRVHEQMSDILPDYIPIDLSEKIQPVNQSVWVENGNDETQTFSVEVDRTQETLVKTNFPQQTILQFARAVYPGWVTMVDGEVVTNSVSKQGNLQAIVPAGAHTIGVQLQGTVVRNTSDLISLFFVFTIVFFLLKSKKIAN